MNTDNTFEGEIIVASRIVDYLSSGIYKSPAACLKELINNAFDADATEVNLFIKPDADRIIVDDNGIGMDRADFEKHFKKISESYKREESSISNLGRPKIGKIGIGFIAANEICNVMEIISTKKGSDELLEVSINFDIMRQDPAKRKREDTALAKGDYNGKVSRISVEKHFTQVLLKGVRGHARNILAGAGSTSFSAGSISMYGLSADSIFRLLTSGKVKTWSKLDAYSKNMLEIALNVPVKYYNNWLPKELKGTITQIESEVSELGFSLYIDGSEMKKPIILQPEGKSIIEPFEYSGKNVAAKGYFYAQNKAIQPQELQGVLLRIRNAAVGEYDPTFFGFSPSTGPLFQKWISGEIYADDRLEDAMNIDRRTLRIAHPAYVELQSALHDFIASFIKRIRHEIYGEGSQARKQDKADKIKAKIIKIANQEIKHVAPDASSEIVEVWSDTGDNEKLQRKILKKYSVDELYQIVIDVAEEILDEKQLELFIMKLTERIIK